MSTSYNMPMHRTLHNSDDYSLENSYSPDGVTSAGMGWDEQSDGGGKFRLKRRRRCGQCGPCQVKENCNKCQYCLRKDVLKQACVYRKCVYLRKPVPRFRQEPATTGAASHKSTPTPPNKTTSTPVPPAPTNSNSNSSSNSNNTNSGTASNNSSMTPVPISSSIPPEMSHSAELSSCRLIQSPFSTLSAMQSSNNGVLDPLRHRMMEHPHRSLFDPMTLHSSHDHSRTAIDASKSVLADAARYPGGHPTSGLSPHCKLDQTAAAITYASELNPNSASVTSHLNSVNSALGTYQSYQCNKGPSLPPRDAYFPSMDTWSSVPYTVPHASSWATQALPNHAAAAAYGFQQHSTTFPSSFTPSCRLGLPDPAAPQFASPAGPQHSFHHSMTGFPHDFTHAASSHASMRRPMNPAFYHTPSHIPASSISSFHGLGHFPASQTSFGPAAYSMHPHTHMYPSGFYSFRTATEPQIYHVQMYLDRNPFIHTPLTFNQEEKTKKDKLSLFDFSKDVGHNILQILCLSLDSSHLISSNKEAASSTTFIKYHNVTDIISEQGTAQASCIPCNIHFVNDKHEHLNYFENVNLSNAKSSKKMLLLAKSSNRGILSYAKSSKNVKMFAKSSNRGILSYAKSSKNVKMFAKSNKMMKSLARSSKKVISLAKSSKKVISLAKSSKKVISLAKSSKVISLAKSSKKVKSLAKSSKMVKSLAKSSKMVKSLAKSSKEVISHATKNHVVSSAHDNKIALDLLTHIEDSSIFGRTPVETSLMFFWLDVTFTVALQNHSHHVVVPPFIWSIQIITFKIFMPWNIIVYYMGMMN